MRTLFFLLTFLLASSSFANNPGVSYQGRIFKPDGTALEGTAVQFRMQVRSPGSENCLLYEEVQTLNMAGSAGVFSLTMNDGTGTRLDSPTYQVDRIFANRGTMTLDTSRCATGTDYTPNSSDGRKLVVYFKDETMAAYEAMPIMNLNYVPQSMYALESQKVGTFAVTNILRAVDGSGNPAAAPALDPTQLTNLTNLLAGTSTQYATAAQFSTIQTFATTAPPTCGPSEVLKSNGTVLSCVTDSAGGAPAYSAITAASAANTIDNANFAQTWNWSTATTQSPMSMSANALTTGSAMNVTTSSASLNSTNGLLNVANTGASTNGILARFQSNSTAGSGLTVLTNGNVGIGTTSPASALQVSSSASLDGITLNAAQTAGNTVFSKWIGNLGSGSYNSIVQSGDMGLIYGGTTVTNSKGFALAPWNASVGGLRMDGVGKVGIGLSSPAFILDVNADFTMPDPMRITRSINTQTIANNLVLDTNYSGGAGATGLGSGILFRAESSTTLSRDLGSLQMVFADGTDATRTGEMLFSTVNSAGAISERMRISGSGNVGVGTTSPEAKLDVVDTSTTTSAIIVPRAGNFTGTEVNGMIRYNTTSTLFEFRQNGSWVNYTTVSDGRLKTNVVPVVNGLDIVNRLNPVFYDWDRNNPKASSFTDKHQVGFIAQEVETVLPEVVNRGEDSYRSVEYGQIVSVAVAAIKELYARVIKQDQKNETQDRELASVKSENATIKQENAALKARLDLQEKELAAIKKLFPLESKKQ